MDNALSEIFEKEYFNPKCWIILIVGKNDFVDDNFFTKLQMIIEY